MDYYNQVKACQFRVHDFAFAFQVLQKAIRAANPCVVWHVFMSRSSDFAQPRKTLQEESKYFFFQFCSNSALTSSTDNDHDSQIGEYY